MKMNENSRGLEAFAPDQWSVDSTTGMVTLKEDALKQILNADSFEKWYILDPQPLAKGQYAVVHHCYHRVTGVEYAAKFSSRWRLGADCSSNIIHEIAVCAMLKPTAKAVQLVDVFSTTREIILVMEYAPGGDLQTLLDEDIIPYERDVVAFLRQLLETLVFIHDKNIVHLDIKPQNLVLMGEFPDCDVKLCDFEISRMLTDDRELLEILGTTDYVAPEILHYEPITTSSDMWSVGVLTYVLLTGYLPWVGETDQETVLEISKCELDFSPQLFEDITPDALDFMKKLLIRQPERRMSARDSLNHVWMQKHNKRPTPPNSLNLANINTPLKPDESHKTEESKPRSPSGHQCVEKSASCPLSGSSESLEKTPDVSNSPFPFPFSNIRRPPIHPSISQRSIFSETQSNAGTPVTTPGSLLSCPFIYKTETRASRQNLERLKSLSKSREVISGKIQPSSFRKSQTKSRDRLFDFTLGDSKSREQLNALRSLSQSVEALTALSKLHKKADELFASCNTIFGDNRPSLLLPHDEQGRMYQSLADINQIDKNPIPRYYDSTVSLNTDTYTDRLTQKNTELNCLVGETYHDPSKSPSGLRANNCRGGREGNCGEPTIKTERSEKQSPNKAPKLSKASKMKKGAQKRRKERKESDEEKQKEEKKAKSKPRSASVSDVDVGKAKEKALAAATSPTTRRGSVSHVEQRIQERNERKQREERRNSTRRQSNLDSEKSSSSDKSKPSKSTSSSTQKPKSHLKLRRTRALKSVSPFSSDVSQASSLESVEIKIDSPSYHTIHKMFIVPEVRVISDNPEDTPKSVDSLSPSNEIYKLREDILRRTEFSSEGSCDSDHTIIGLPNVNKDSASESSDETTEVLSVSEKIQNFEKVLSTGPANHNQLPKRLDSHLLTAERLDIINEEDSSSDRCDSRTEFQRSISNTSDLGSSASDISSTVGEEKHDSMGCTLHKEPLVDTKTRNRSYSVHSRPIDMPKFAGRSRSNSLHISDKMQGRPWGSLCNGAVARAFEKFNFVEADISPSISPKTSPTFTHSKQVAVSN